jgi:hypothetical protein
MAARSFALNSSDRNGLMLYVYINAIRGPPRVQNSPSLMLGRLRGCAFARAPLVAGALILDGPGTVARNYRATGSTPPPVFKLNGRSICFSLSSVFGNDFADQIYRNQHGSGSTGEEQEDVGDAV